MFDLGEELSIESSRIPWLIWIQLIVFLLLLLLFCFILIAFDPSHDSPTATATVSASPDDIHHSTATTVINRLHNTRVQPPFSCSVYSAFWNKLKLKYLDRSLLLKQIQSQNFGFFMLMTIYNFLLICCSSSKLSFFWSFFLDAVDNILIVHLLGY